MRTKDPPYYGMVDTPTFAFLKKEQDAFLVRERNVQAYLAFLHGTKQNDNEVACALLGQVVIPEVMKLIFDFACSPRKYRME